MVYRPNKDIQERIDLVWKQSFQGKSEMDQKLALLRIFVDCMEGCIGIVETHCSEPEESETIKEILRKKYQA